MLSALNRAKVFSIIALPLDNDAAVITTTLAHVPITQIGEYEPTFTLSNISALRTKIDNALTVMSAETQQLVEAQIADWDEIGPTSPMTISDADNGIKGTIVDANEKRRNIRMYIGNIIGVFVPKDGWIGELQRMGMATGYPYNGTGDR